MSPISDDPRKAARQLANLKRGGNPAPAGNRLAVKHGGYARVIAGTLDTKIEAIRAALEEDAPLQHAADAAMIHQLAELMHRRDGVSANLTAYGLFDETGNERPAVGLYLRFANAVLDHAESMGMTPRSRAKLGLDVARAQTFDLAKHWADDRADDTIEGEAAS